MSSNNKLDLEIKQGSDFERALQLTRRDGTPIPITTDTFSGQILTSYSAAAATKTFTFATLVAADGTVIMSLANTDTSELTIGATYVYKVMRTLAGKKTRLMWGKIKITP